MPLVTPAELAQMQALLASGPILLGESHDLGHARVAIRDLIDLHVVKFLSVETPVGPVGMVKADGQIRPDKVGTYFGGVATLPNAVMTTRQLVEHAMAANVAVYCHDVPLRKNPLNFLENSEDLTAYPNFARTFLPATMLDLPINNGAAANLFIQRNEYSANYLRSQLGNGVKCLFNLVVLGGADHFKADLCGAARTLQHHLGVGGNRVFIAD